MGEKKLSYDRLLQIFKRYIHADLCNTESGYVLENLRKLCGCSDEEIAELGYDYLLDVERWE